MTRREIVQELAENKVVERLALNVARAGSLNADLQDLCQSVYLILLEYDEDKIVDLYESNAMHFFIVRILTNQYHSQHSPFHNEIRKFRGLCFELRQDDEDED